jgi:uncharacterized protein (TIGR03086 family)
MTFDLPDVHARAVANTQRIVDAVTPDKMHNPTPCDGWDVAELIHHIVYGNLWVGPLVAGETIEQVGDRFEGDVVGDDIAAAHRASGAVAVDAFNAPGAMDAPCAVSYGPVPGSVYCGHRFIDVLVHGWDLAVGAGGDTELPPDLVDACIEVILPQADLLGGSGAYGSSSDPGDTVPPQTRLLALLGRKG